MFPKYEQSLRALAFDFFQNREDAEDAIQEVSMKLVDMSPPEAGNVDGWAYVVIMNALKDEYRKMKTRNKPVPMIQDELEDCNDPFEYAAAAEVAVMLEDNYNNLPKEIREACYLRYHEGLSYEAIAEIQQIPPGTVGSRIHRGKEMLSFMLDIE